VAGAQLNGIPVSAPGALSTRTDRQPVRDIPNAAYGENKAFTEIQAGAPMQQTPAPKPPAQLFAPSGRPDEPVTSGANTGEGPGREAVAPQPASGLVPTGASLTSTLSKLAVVDPSNERMASLLALAQKFGW
jgi:hypothetical protein